MATALMSEPCGGACSEDAQYLVTLGITSLEMITEASAEASPATGAKDKDIFIAVTWDGNVVKMRKEDKEAEDFNSVMTWTIFATAQNFSTKLKTSPMLFELSKGCDGFGTTKMAISDCYSDAVLCEEFTSETVVNEFTFVKDGEETATMKAFFRVQKLLDDGLMGSVFKMFKSKMSKFAKKRNGEGEDGEDDSDNEDACKDFACPDELTEKCKQLFGLNKAVYRIVNGNLVNVKDRLGPCGEKCDVASRLIKELPTLPANEPVFSTRFQFNDCTPKCNEIFTTSCQPKASYDCDKKKPPFTAPTTRKPCKDDWIDRNIQEESILKKLCDKHGIDVDDLEEVEQEADDEGGPQVCLKGKKIKKKKRSTRKCNDKCPLRVEEKVVCESDYKETIDPETCQIIKKKKRKSSYVYNFGSSYPLHRSCSNVERGGGDAPFVPKNMGWRWDQPIFGIAKKTCPPGQISKTVRCLMKHALNPFPYDTIPLTKRDKLGRIISRGERIKTVVIQKPTIDIQKKDGEYRITMHPMKDKKKLATDCDPYLNCSPLKFVIKKHPEAIKKHRAKKMLRERGLVKKCSCENLQLCRCKGTCEKKVLKFAVQKASKMFKLQEELKYEDLYESSDSEVDMKFTTPSATIEKCKADVIHRATQYEMRDFKPLTMKEVRAQWEEDERLRLLALMNKNQKGSSKDEKKKPKPGPKKQVISILLDPPCPRPIAAPKCVTIQPNCCGY